MRRQLNRLVTGRTLLVVQGSDHEKARFSIVGPSSRGLRKA